MNKKLNLYRVAVAAYAVVLVAFAVFFIYMGNCEHVSVESVRGTQDSRVVEDYEVKELEDLSAPIHVREEYSWILDGVGAGNTALAFYSIHQYAQVYIDGELVYSLMPAQGNRVGRTTSSNWVIVPLRETDNGREIRVVLTPVYESVRGRTPRFEISSYYGVFRSQLMDNLPQLMLAFTCFVVNVFIMLIQIYFVWKKKTQSWDIFFLGNATLLIGLWKFTDTAFSPLIFGNTKALGFVVIGLLFLMVIPLTLFLHGRYRDYRPSAMLGMSLLLSGAAMLALVLQVAGVADFKQTLPLAHVMILLVAVRLLLLAIGRKRRMGKAQLGQSFWFSALLIVGAVMDLFMYYRTKSTAKIGYSLLAVLLYTVGLFTADIMETRRRANTDMLTGLFNKYFWESLMDDPDPSVEKVGVIMMDLNRLKYVNDTMGHESGDKMICSFAGILRDSLPPESTICRWGGDEFAVLLANAGKEDMERYAQKIQTAVGRCNASGKTPSLQYAIGYAVSDEFPGLTRRELFRKADERMYLDKQKWYVEHHIEKK